MTTKKTPRRPWTPEERRMQSARLRRAWRKRKRAQAEKTARRDMRASARRLQLDSAPGLTPAQAAGFTGQPTDATARDHAAALRAIRRVIATHESPADAIEEIGLIIRVAL